MAVPDNVLRSTAGLSFSPPALTSMAVPDNVLPLSIAGFSLSPPPLTSMAVPDNVLALCSGESTEERHRTPALSLPLIERDRTAL